MTKTAFALLYPALSGYEPMKCEDCGRVFDDGEKVEVVDRTWRGITSVRCLDGCPTGLGVESDVEPSGAETHPESDDDGEVGCVSGGVEEAEHLEHEEDQHFKGSLEGSERTTEEDT
jgi:ferredoxin